jgi:ABC-type antimicrobial peptide transport system permease subunit
VADAARERRREFGIRLALGATPAGVSRRLLRDGLVLALAGVPAGLLVAPALSRMMDRGLAGAAGLSAGEYLAACAVLLLVAAFACLLPAWRAGRVSLVAMLRDD